MKRILKVQFQICTRGGFELKLIQLSNALQRRSSRWLCREELNMCDKGQLRLFECVGISGAKGQGRLPEL